MALQPGQSFGNYQIVRLIGEGGFGEVYLAENPLIERRAAVKVLHPSLAQDAELVRRFLNEARAASSIRHPNIIDVFDAGATANGAPYILMEFLEGMSLKNRLASQGRLSVAQTLHIANQAGSALAAAHAIGIVHRDFKPENLFLVPAPGFPGGEKVVVLDFGIAKINRPTGLGGTVRTQTGVIMGSPAYMSPEQCKDSADVDHRSDIYSFATILYEMVTGRTPHVSTSGIEMLVMHLTKSPQPLRELAVDAPEHFEAAVMRGLSRERNDRFDTMASFLDALRPGAGASANANATVIDVSTSRIATSATSAIPIQEVAQTALLSSDTTFSRAAVEMTATGRHGKGPETIHRRNWLPFAIGGVAAVGLGLFLLVRPGHQLATPGAPVSAQSSAAPQPSAAEPAPTDPVAEPEPAQVQPVVNPPPAEPSRPLHAARRIHPVAPTPSAPVAKKKRRADDEWIAH